MLAANSSVVGSRLDSGQMQLANDLIIRLDLRWLIAGSDCRITELS